MNPVPGVHEDREGEALRAQGGVELARGASLRCRFCSRDLGLTLVDLGETPLANSFVDPAKAATPDASYPLHARVCESCYLVRVDDVVPREAIFSNYAYFSSSQVVARRRPAPPRELGISQIEAFEALV